MKKEKDQIIEQIVLNILKYEKETRLIRQRS